MDLRKVEAIGTGKARKELYEMLRRAQDGTHYLLLRFDRPVAALVSHEDYLAFSELARQDALAKAVLQGKGYDPSANDRSGVPRPVGHQREGGGECSQVRASSLAPTRCCGGSTCESSPVCPDE